MGEWRETTLGEVVQGSGGSFKTGPFGTTLKASAYSDTGVPIISVGEVGYGRLRIRDTTPRADRDVVARLPEYLLHAGDIVFGRKGAVDRSALVLEAEDGWFLGSDGLRVRMGPTAHSAFISYQLQSASTRTWLLQHASGSTLLSLNQQTLGRVPLALPPFDEQRAIAEVLGALDDKIATNTTLAATADELASAILRSALSSGETAELSSISQITMGSSPPGTSYNEVGEGVVFYQGVRDFGFRFPLSRVWTTAPARMAEAGDTFLSVRAPVGNVNIATEPTCIGRGLASVRSRLGTPWTLFHLLKATPNIWEPFEAEGTVFGSINQKQLNGITVPTVPSEFATQTESRLAALEERLDSALKESARLAATRDALLPALMSRALRVRDAERVVESAL